MRLYLFTLTALTLLMLAMLTVLLAVSPDPITGEFIIGMGLVTLFDAVLLWRIS